MQPNDRVRAEIFGVLNKQVIGLLSRLFTHLSKSPYIATNNTFYFSSESLCNSWRSDNNPSYDAFILFYPESFKI